MRRPRKRASSVAVIDIGSNSVRLVVYESLTRSLVSLFNEKTLCGLGREVQSTGLLAPDEYDVAGAATGRPPKPATRLFSAMFDIWSTAVCEPDADTMVLPVW